jgi:hypothetical protein
VLFETFSGYDLDLKVGPITLMEMVFAADKTRSGSTRILGRLGAIVANMPTTSSDFVVERSSLSGKFSRNPIGLVVKIAVSSRRKRSYESQR